MPWKIWTAAAELSEESAWLLHPISVETYIKEVGLHAHLIDAGNGVLI